MTNTELLVGNMEWISKTARRFVKQDDLADDLASQTVELALASIDSFVGTAHKMKGWLFVIMKNALLKDRRGDRVLGKSVPIWRTPYGNDDIEDPSAIDPADVHGENDMVEAIYDAVESLPIVFRETMLLRIDGYPDAEIAKKQGIPEGTVRSRIFRARALLEDSINNIGIEV